MRLDPRARGVRGTAARGRDGRRRRRPSWWSAARSWRRAWAPSSTAPGARPSATRRRRARNSCCEHRRPAALPGRAPAAGRRLPRGRARSAPSRASERLEEAMRYSLLAGGKRIRPVLALATAEALGRDPAEVHAVRGRDRDDPHLLADPRRPAGDGRRRAAPRKAHLPRGVRRGRRDPRRRRPVRRGAAAGADRAGGRARRRARRGRRADRRRRRGRHGGRPVPRRDRRRRPRRRPAAAPARAEDGAADRGLGDLRLPPLRSERTCHTSPRPLCVRARRACSRSSTTSST